MPKVQLKHSSVTHNAILSAYRKGGPFLRKCDRCSGWRVCLCVCVFVHVVSCKDSIACCRLGLGYEHAEFCRMIGICWNVFAMFWVEDTIEQISRFGEIWNVLWMCFIPKWFIHPWPQATASGLGQNCLGHETTVEVGNHPKSWPSWPIPMSTYVIPSPKKSTHVGPKKGPQKMNGSSCKITVCGDGNLKGTGLCVLFHTFDLLLLVFVKLWNERIIVLSIAAIVANRLLQSCYLDLGMAYNNLIGYMAKL